MLLWWQLWAISCEKRKIVTACDLIPFCHFPPQPPPSLHYFDSIHQIVIRIYEYYQNWCWIFPDTEGFSDTNFPIHWFVSHTICMLQTIYAAALGCRLNFQWVIGKLMKRPFKIDIDEDFVAEKLKYGFALVRYIIKLDFMPSLWEWIHCIHGSIILFHQFRFFIIILWGHFWADDGPIFGIWSFDMCMKHSLHCR